MLFWPPLRDGRGGYREYGSMEFENERVFVVYSFKLFRSRAPFTILCIEQHTVGVF